MRERLAQDALDAVVPGAGDWRAGRRPARSEGAEALAYDRERWTEQSFFHDADRGVLYADAPWDTRWRAEEWWR